MTDVKPLAVHWLQPILQAYGSLASVPNWIFSYDLPPVNVDYFMSIEAKELVFSSYIPERGLGTQSST